MADFDKREILVKDKKLDLTLKEFELLEILIRNKGKILTRDTLLDKIWGYEYIGETRTVDVHIRYLRKKIEEDDKKFADRLLYKARVATVPGSCFGETGKGYLRISLGAKKEEITEQKSAS